MNKDIFLTNNLTNKKEIFVPLTSNVNELSFSFEEAIEFIAYLGI